MLIYYNAGLRDFMAEPVPINSRSAWEFYISLSGRLAPTLPGAKTPRLAGPAVWVLPREHAHGWTGEEAVERVVMHFTVVPGELEKLVPSCGYYRVKLTKLDCARIRQLQPLAHELIARPTRLAFLQTQGLVTELSLLALRTAAPSPLTASGFARGKTEQALAWYREHLDKKPCLKKIAEAVYVSPTHLRRLFCQVRGESPHRACNRIRMQRAEDLLKSSTLTMEAIAGQLGFSNASALSRAVRIHFGITAKDLRRGHRPLRMHTDPAAPA